MYQIVNELPTVNLTDDFLILKGTESSIKTDWMEFCDHFICNEIQKETSGLSKNQEIKDYIQGSYSFVSFSPNLKNIFGFDKHLQILEFQFTSGIYSIITKVSYQEIFNKYYHSKNIKINNKTYTPKSILSRFFIFQKNKSKLLFPLNINTLGQIQYDFEALFNQYPFYAPFLKYLHNHSTPNYRKYEIKSFNVLLCCSTWKNANEILNEDINKIQNFFITNKTITSQNIKNSLLTSCAHF